MLPKLKSDLTQMMLDILDNKDVKPEFHDDAFLGVVMAAKGYPGSYTKNIPLRNPDELRQWLRPRAHTMPRTALRYAIEKFPETERRAWLEK